MVTSVDTSVLIDFFTADPNFGLHAKHALEHCRTDGAVIVCEVVWAELSALFPTAQGLHSAMDRLNIDYDSLQTKAASTAGRIWKRYRSQGGKRTRVIADFLIAAHAMCQANQLLTRDRGFTRKYFSDLQVIDPTAIGP